MAKRKPLSKAERYEILKRDKFTCQYCGAKAPDVILEIDHIIPVAEGGTNETVNLITACRDCNRGKGKKMLTDTAAIDRQRKQLEDLSDMKEQNEMLIEWKRELMTMVESQIDSIEEQMLGLGFLKDNQCLSRRGRAHIRDLINRFGFNEVYHAVEVAFDAYIYKRRWTFEPAFDKIGGICWNEMHQKEEQNG